MVRELPLRLNASFRAPTPKRAKDDMLKFGWCLDGVHEKCKNSYTIKVNKASEKTRGKVEQVEVSGECSCECHA